MTYSTKHSSGAESINGGSFLTRMAEGQVRRLVEAASYSDGVIRHVGQARAMLQQVMLDHVGDRVRALWNAWRVGLVIGRLLAALIELGAWKAAGWTGPYSTLARVTGYGERQIRRAMKALRAAGIVEGEPLAPEQGEDGKWLRSPGTYRLRLPRWCQARHWRLPQPSASAGEDVSPAPPTGHERPDSRVTYTSDAYKQEVVDALEPVDRPPDGPRRYPVDYLTARPPGMAPLRR